MSEPEIRRFVAGPSGEVQVMAPHEVEAHMGISPALSAGYDILTDDGYPAQEASDLLVAAERNGYDPEAMARKMVRLRKVLRHADAQNRTVKA